MSTSKLSSRITPSAVAANTISTSVLTAQTSGRGFVDLTAEIVKFVKDVGAREGAVTLFIRHTSASLTIQENADPSVLDDLTMRSTGWRPSMRDGATTAKAPMTCPDMSRPC